MGFTLPSPTSPAEITRSLIAQRKTIEADIDAQVSILKANSSTLHSPLVDPDGFPRADIDVYAVRGARVRLIELKNDLDAVMTEIGKALERVYDPTIEASAGPDSSSSVSNTEALRPFAKVDGVAPGSPAAEAGLQRGDLVVKFGALTQRSFPSSSIEPLATLVAGSENLSLPISVLRGEEQQMTQLNLTPQKWGGRGLLGCHIVPYSPP